jgi:hypothetical protein
LKLVHACLSLLLAVSAVPVVVADERNACVISPDASRYARVADLGLRAVAPADDRRSPVIGFECRGESLSGVSVAIVPGQRSEIRLLAGSGTLAGEDLLAVGGPLSEWSLVTSQPREAGGRDVTLTLSVPASAKIGRVFSGHLRPGGAGSGVEIPLTLELIEEEPLFRDEFDVDPVIGQFSFVQ